MIYVTGKSTTIIQELEHLVNEPVVKMNFDLATFNYGKFKSLGADACDKYVLCAGVLYPKTILEQNISDIVNNISVNMLSAIALCESILNGNDNARIVVMGSASGVKGSYDTVYAAAKAGLHQYVRNKELKPNQQLVAVAPSIIGDSGMTSRRTDAATLSVRSSRHPKRRFITAAEIASMIYYLLYVDRGYTTNTIINMTGGEVRW